MTSLNMAKSESYTRSFGYPCSTDRGLITDEERSAKQNKKEGWVYR